MAKKAGRAKKAKQENSQAAAPVAEASTEAETAKPVKAKAERTKRRPRRGGARKAAPKSVAKAAGKKSPRGSRRGRRYTPAEKAKILAAARAEGLTGAQVAERFGVSTLSYYTWRKKAGTPKRRGRKPGRPATAPRARSVSEDANGIAELFRRAVRAQLDRLLPQVLKSELESALSGRRSRRR